MVSYMRELISMQDIKRSALYENNDRVLSRSKAEGILDEVVSHTSKKGRTRIVISSWWGGGQRWARNTPSMTADQREMTISIKRNINGGAGECETNQIDSISIKGAVGLAERYAIEGERFEPLDMATQIARWNYDGANVWSDATYNHLVTENGKSVNEIIGKSLRDSLLSAGYVGTCASTALVYDRDSWGRENIDWGSLTYANCSVTVRHPKGLGSAWAGSSSFDITRWDINSIAELSYEKCRASLNPVRIEPGRYITILEPQAVATLMQSLISSLSRTPPESKKYNSPIYSGFDSDMNRHLSKIGQKLVDDRINIYHDPNDPIVGTHRSDIVRRVDLIRKGILTEPYNTPVHELVELNSKEPAVRRLSFKVDGGDTPVDEMITSTRRGLVVARLEQPVTIDEHSLLQTGVTRDGIWLIENGKIAKAVKNFRWTESPLVAFNNIEDIGVSEPVFNEPLGRAPLVHNFHDSMKNIMVPAIRVRDFNFSSTIDSI